MDVKFESHNHKNGIVYPILIDKECDLLFTT